MRVQVPNSYSHLTQSAYKEKHTLKLMVSYKLLKVENNFLS